jgi:FAD/FMN-containing dehydrogenase
MNRVLAYDPQDLTLGVEPGVRIDDLARTLAEKKQFLPLAVPFSNRATIGGIVAANSSSPLRHAHGGIRDFCLGMEFVTGEGAQAKSGGRVVKNVTGYDLHKLLIGSLGTLAVITRVNFRTFPMPQAQGTFVASFSSAEGALIFAARSPTPFSRRKCWKCRRSLPPRRLIFSAASSARIQPAQWSVVISAAGQPAVVDRYARELGHLAGAANAAEFLPLERCRTIYRSRPHPRISAPGLGTRSGAAIFRIGVLPTAWLPCSAT